MRHTDASSLACLLRPRDQRFSRRYCYKSRKLKKFTSPHSIILIGAGSIDFEIESPVAFAAFDPTTSLQKMAVKGMTADVADGSKTEVSALPSNFRFTPTSRHQLSPLRRLLCAAHSVNPLPAAA